MARVHLCESACDPSPAPRSRRVTGRFWATWSRWRRSGRGRTRKLVGVLAGLSIRTRRSTGKESW